MKPCPDIGDLRPFALVDPHLAIAFRRALWLATAAQAQIANTARTSRRPEDGRELARHRRSLWNANADMTTAMLAYRECRGTRDAVIGTIQTLHAAAANIVGKPASLTVGPEVIGRSLDDELRRSLETLLEEMSALNDALKRRSEDHARLLAERINRFERDVANALDALNRGTGPRSRVVAAVIKVRVAMARCLATKAGAA